MKRKSFDEPPEGFGALRSAREGESSLHKKAKSPEQAFHLLASLPADFIAEREDSLPQVRHGL